MMMKQADWKWLEKRAARMEKSADIGEFIRTPIGAALLGAGGGGLVGGGVGWMFGRPWTGAAIGAPTGGLAGALIGSGLQSDRHSKEMSNLRENASFTREQRHRYEDTAERAIDRRMEALRDLQKANRGLQKAKREREQLALGVFAATALGKSSIDRDDITPERLDTLARKIVGAPPVQAVKDGLRAARERSYDWVKVEPVSEQARPHLGEIADLMTRVRERTGGWVWLEPYIEQLHQMRETDGQRYDPQR